MNDNDIIKALDICDKLDFFGGQRAGRELWSSKPVSVQDEDIRQFVKDVAFVKDFINRLLKEIEDMHRYVEDIRAEYDTNDTARAEAIKEFAEKLKKESRRYYASPAFLQRLDALVKEMTEEQK